MDGAPQKRIIAIVLYGLGLATAIALFFMDPISQWPEYYGFADGRAWLGIPNAQNVLSNIPFLIVGLLGIFSALRNRAAWMGHQVADRAEYRIIVILYAGTTLLFFGSSYFHLLPIDSRLAWDRYTVLLTMLPLMCAVIADRMGTRIGYTLLGPMILFGFASVIVWRLTGDLRFYGFMQFYPAAAAIIMLVFLPSRYTHSRYLYLILVLFVISKLSEHFDQQVYDVFGGIIGGHAIKHVLAATAVWVVLRWVSRRELLTDPDR